MVLLALMVLMVLLSFTLTRPLDELTQPLCSFPLRSSFAAELWVVTTSQLENSLTARAGLPAT